MSRAINAAGAELIQSFEKCKLEAYPDPVTRGDPWTIGWGHTGDDVHEGKTITQAEADELFQADLRRFEDAVSRLVKVPLTDNQFGALVSFTFNLGAGALQSSFLLRCLNVKNYAGAATQFEKWNHGHVNGVLREIPGLTARRKAERALFEA